ncbi:MAG: hypothetical protein U1D68_06095 [Arthrobacter sp.]|nr:hypothetical protein [Arthrobacter sp.]MDZ4353497.1 hypothetical protein [Arthrobacter sp.]
MTVEVAEQVLSCEELSVGDEIEAWHNGKLFHRGEVIRTVAATDLFWILDERTGMRRLIDAEVLVIRRVAVPATRQGPAAACGSAAMDRFQATRGPSSPHGSAAPASAGPASHVPLFQAPSLVP